VVPHRPGLTRPRELTADEEAVLSHTREEWAGMPLAAGPTNREAAEAGLYLAYRAAGLAPPERVVWLGSPLHGGVAAAAITGPDIPTEARGLGGRVRAELRAQGWPAAGVRPGRPVRSWVGPLLWAKLRPEVEAQVGRHLWALVWARTGRELSRRLLDGGRPGPLERALEDRILPELEEWSLDVIDQAVSGALDAVWCGVAAGVRNVFPGVHGPERLAGLERVTAAAGWWWPFERVVVICERPASVHRDEAGRLHRSDGPALAWPDGFAVHAWHGMPVPAELIARLADVRIDDIHAERNVELRRVLLEHYGFDRYLREVGATRLQQDAAGTLWQAALPGDEPLVMVEVVNATPEPDGTCRVYWLRVPPGIRTAREGVAWTFGLSEDRYRPVRES
jgi:hypothetical protein